LAHLALWTNTTPATFRTRFTSLLPRSTPFAGFGLDVALDTDVRTLRAVNVVSRYDERILQLPDKLVTNWT